MLIDVVLFLAAAVIAVPLFKRLGLGAVLGYLAAGIVIGPSGLGLIPEVEQVYSFSSFGVVLLLFVIGLELQLSSLWRLRTHVFGYGSAQVLLSTAALGSVALALGQPWVAALIAGFALSMSSDALVLQMLAERKELADRHGRAAFAILLFQDFPAIAALGLLPLFAAQVGAASGHPLLGALRVIGAIALVIFAGRYLLRPVFRAIAWSQVPEIFTAAALLVVTATAVLMDAVGLAMALGAFLAGVLLADSEYRHELQADIEPFKGLLLGLFFMAVGMSADLHYLREHLLLVATTVAGFMAIKTLVLMVVGRIAGLDGHASRRLSVALAQGGEFGIVILGVAVNARLVSGELRDLLLVSVTLSLIATPLLYALLERFDPKREHAAPFDEISVPGNDVIIAGFGPFGQIFGRLLRVKKIPFTVLEKNWQHVDFVRQFGNRVFYSDASRVEVLRAAGAANARFFVLAIANLEESLRIAETVRHNFPHLRIFAVSSDRMHTLKLMDLGVTDVVRRAFYSSLKMTGNLLRALGESDAQVEHDLERFRRHDHDTLLKQAAIFRDEKQLIQTARESAQELERLFEDDLASNPAKVP